MSWNYRVGTYLYSYKKKFPNNEKFHENDDIRMFCIIAAYYTDGQDIPHSYGDRIPLDFDDFSDLKDTLKKFNKAIKKPVLNLDDWPFEFKRKNLYESLQCRLFKKK